MKDKVNMILKHNINVFINRYNIHNKKCDTEYGI